MAKARIKARCSFKVDYAVEYFEAAAQDVQRSKEASLYGLALAYMRAEKIEKAKAIMDELIAKDRGNLFYLDAMTDIYISQGEPLKAVEMLRPHVTHNPRNQAAGAEPGQCLHKRKQI